MRFKVVGTVGDDDVSIVWNDGLIETDEITGMMLETDAKHTELEVPTMALEASDFSDPLAFLFFAQVFLDTVESVSGDIPTMPSVPVGAVA